MAERIMYITSQFPYGRREAFLGAEARALAALSADVTIVAVRPQSKRPSAETGARGVALRTLSGDFVRDVWETLRTQPDDVLAVIREMCSAPYRPAAKLKNLAVFGKGLALAAFARREQITFIHAHWLTTPSTVAYIAARLARIPWSVSAHNFDLFADNWIAEKVAAASAVRVISERGAQDLRDRLPNSVWDRIHVVHLGVQTPLNAAPARSHAGPLRIAAVGFLVAFKGHCDLIDAVALLRERGVPVECTISGDGPLRAALLTHIERRGVSRIVKLRGFVPHAKVMQELAGGLVDVLAHPSIEDGTLHEGIPVSLMEAMAFGIPCVTTRTGSIPELVDASCGIVVEQRDPAALARALETLAVNPALRARLGAAARERVASHFDVQGTTLRLLDLIRTPSMTMPTTAR